MSVFAMLACTQRAGLPAFFGWTKLLALLVNMLCIDSLAKNQEKVRRAGEELQRA